MNKAKRNSTLAALVALALLPGAALAQSDNTSQVTTPVSGNTATTIGTPEGFNGIFSCNQQGAYSMSVGALGASGGVYVPVADASVELNTGTLVYKECVLREVVDAERETAIAGFDQQATNNVQTGRAGAPEYVVNEGQELTNVGTNAVTNALKNGTLSSLDPAIQSQVTQAVAQGYATAVYNAPSSLACPYQGATTAFSNTSQALTFNTILALASDCNPLLAYNDANALVTNQGAVAQQYQQDQLDWGNGYYAVTTGSASNPLGQQIVTPSSLVNSSYSQVIQSGFTQLQNANDLGQMVGALFAGISTQVLAGNGGGLTGLTQSVGGQPSYLDQVVSQTSQNLQTSITNTALANLDAALQVEESYFNIMNSIAGTLSGSISQLRSAENECWGEIIQQVCATPLSSNNTCTEKVSCTPGTQVTESGFSVSTNQTTTCPTGATLDVATSTEFSQAVINAQIASLASTTANNLNVSQEALNLINQLIQNVQNTSADSQAIAVEQLNTLIENNELHTEPELTTAQTQQQSVQGSMTTLVQNTIQQWAGTNPNDSTQTNLPWDGSISPGTGWCNFQNQTTLQMWEQKWSQ